MGLLRPKSFSHFFGAWASILLRLLLWLHHVVGLLRPRSFPKVTLRNGDFAAQVVPLFFVLRLGFLLDFTFFGGAAQALQASSFSVLALIWSFLRFSSRMLQKLQRHVFF